MRRETSLTYKGESKRDALSILLRSAWARPRRTCTSSRLKDEAMWLCAADMHARAWSLAYPLRSTFAHSVTQCTLYQAQHPTQHPQQQVS